jgi:hypothetical protein
MYHVACQTWQKFSYPALNGQQRAGQGVTYINKTLLIYGGNNGIDLGDVLQVPLDFKTNETSRNQCKGTFPNTESVVCTLYLCDSEKLVSVFYRLQ